MKKKRPSGFTLIELLIVVGIIGLLVQLALPAVEMARESARRTQCQNQLRQLALASALHEQSHKHLPSGGWSWDWVGDPDRGFGQNQPGGWHYSILPYTEQSQLYDLGRGADVLEKRRLAAELCSTVRAGVNCPSMRRPAVYPVWHRHGVFNAKNSDDTPGGQVRSDYAMNGGQFPMSDGDINKFFLITWSSPKSYAEAESEEFVWPDKKFDTGVVFVRSEIRLPQITDGLTKTYLMGEKSLSREVSKFGRSTGDNLSMYQGYDFDVIRWAGFFDPDYENTYTDPVSSPESQPRAFGGAHPTGFNMAMCDGSVHFVDYSIDGIVHEQRATRAGSEITTNVE